jgi:hypothetical protein
MTVHILRDGTYAILRCPKTDEDALRKALAKGGFKCGTTRDVDDIESLVDLNVMFNNSISKVDGDALRKLVVHSGFDAAD